MSHRNSKQLNAVALLLLITFQGVNSTFGQMPSSPAAPVTTVSASAVPKAMPSIVGNGFAQASNRVENADRSDRDQLSIIRATDGDYVISTNDTIQVAVFQEPDLSVEAIVSRDGTVQLPLINDVKIGGLTVKQARDRIRVLYNQDYLVEPQVSLGVTKFAERKFTIIGQVNSPGTYAITGSESVNLIEAIGMAGGFTRIADRGHVVIKREVMGEVQTMKLNAKKMAGSSTSPIEIRAGDIISVGESWY
jgi:protein involved in polysaccharide export with SLBB domain